jgi:hypothetical protein
MSQTPERYRANDRHCEDKAWLYEQYWGEILSLRTIADKCDVSHQMIAEQLEKFGIPKRTDNYNKHNSVSAFSGFYHNTATQEDGSSCEQYNADHKVDHSDDVMFDHWVGDFEGW